MMLRMAGDEPVDEKDILPFCGDVDADIEDRWWTMGGVLGTVDMADSFSSTFSAKVTIRFAMASNTSVTFTMALLARRQSRPAMAINAYVLLAPRDRGSCNRKM